MPPTTSRTSLYNELQEECTAAKHWRCKLWFQQAESLEDDTPPIDLCDAMTKREHYMFPSHFHGMEHCEALVAEIKIAALLHGFNLVKGQCYYRATLVKRNPNSKRYCSIRLECEQHRRRRDSKSTGKRKRTNNSTSKKSDTLEGCCPFVVNIYLHVDDGSSKSNRWFMASTKRSNPPAPPSGTHSGHYCLETEDLMASPNLLTKEQKELAKQCNQLHLSKSNSAALLSLRDSLGITWDKSQLYYLSRREERLKQNLTADKSSADKLIESFDKRDDVSYCLVSYDRANGLIFLKRDSHKKLDLPSLTEAADLHQRCGFNDDEEMILVFLFASNEEFRHLIMHPEFLACDTTFGVENTKKGLFTIAGIDGNNKAFNAGRAFIPNEQTWIFQMLFSTVIPKFWGKGVAKRVRRVVTDGCPQEYRSLIHSTGPSNPFCNAKHCLCVYHLIVQKWALNFPSGEKLKLEPKGTDVVLDCTFNCLKDWAFRIESLEEYKLSKKRLFDWLKVEEDAKRVSLQISTHIRNFVVKKLQPYEPLFLNCYKKNSPGMGKHTSNACESMHWSTKSGVHAVSPTMSTEVSANAQMDKAERLAREKKKQNAQQALTYKLFAMDDLSNDLTKYAELMSQKEWDMSSKYNCVFFSRSKAVIFIGESKMPKMDGRTRFRRARIVKRKGKYVSCSCMFTSEYMMPCRHVFRVLGKRSQHMFAMRWFTNYHHCFNRPQFEKATKIMRKIRKEECGRNFEAGQHILCSQWPTLPSDATFPLVYGDSIGTNVTEIARFLKRRHELDLPVVNGLPANEQPTQPVEDEEQLSSQGMSTSVRLSNAVATLLNEEAALEGGSGDDWANVEADSDDCSNDEVTESTTYYGDCMDIVKETIKLTENDANLRKEYVAALKEAHGKYARLAAEKEGPRRGRLHFAPSSKYLGEVRRKGY